LFLLLQGLQRETPQRRRFFTDPHFEQARIRGLPMTFGIVMDRSANVAAQEKPAKLF
jgi:hypothetical protein